MILYTSQPMEWVFPTHVEAYTRQKTIYWNSIPLLVEVTQEGHRVLQVLSSEPSHFLIDSISPGQILKN